MPSVGYPQEWVLGGIDLPEDMICTICSELKRDAAKTACGHSFCFDCIATWYRSRDGKPSCPLCRSEHASTAPTGDLLLQREIGALPSKCPHCRFKSPLSVVARHERTCRARPPARTCECAICANTPDVSFEAYLRTLAARDDHPQNSSTVRLVVTIVPRGKPFFFVRREDDEPCRDRARNDAFIHLSSFARIINAAADDYSCSDDAEITVPPVGAMFYGVLGRDAQGRPRVDWRASIARDEWAPDDETDESIYIWTQDDRLRAMLLTQMLANDFSFLSTPTTLRAMMQLVLLPLESPILTRVKNRMNNFLHNLVTNGRRIERLARMQTEMQRPPAV